MVSFVAFHPGLCEMTSEENSPNPDQYDLISCDLEEHILRHPEGRQCLEMLYSLYDTCVAYECMEDERRSAGGTKRSGYDQEYKDAARDWYLDNAQSVRRQNRSKSYKQLANALLGRVLNQPDRTLRRSAETIRRYLNQSAQDWFIRHACELAIQNPRIETDGLIDLVIEVVQSQKVIFSISRRVDVTRYLRESRAVWYVRQGALLVKDQPEISRSALVDAVLAKTASEREEYFGPRDQVLETLQRFDLGG